MCSAAVLKGTPAILIRALQTAERFRVENAVLEELARRLGKTESALIDRTTAELFKAPRFADEMREIATTQVRAGFGTQLYDAIAGVWAAAAVPS